MRVKDARQTFLGYLAPAARSKGGELLVFGDGSQRRDLTYVDDAVDAFLLAAAQRRSAWAASTTSAARPPISSARARRAARRRCGGAGHRRAVPFPDRPQERSTSATSMPTTSAIERDLGWRPEVDARARATTDARVLPRARRRTTGTASERPVPRSRRERRSGSARSSTPRSDASLDGGRYVLGGGGRGVRARVRRVLRRRARGRRRARAPTRSRSPCWPSGSSPATR